jgi:hypothetical protein
VSTVELRVVYWGAPGAGMAESLAFIAARARGDEPTAGGVADATTLTSVALDLGVVGGVPVRLLLQAFHDPDYLRMALGSADAIVFAVASSQAGLLDHPVVVQVSRREGDGALDPRELGLGDAPVIEADHASGQGVFDTLKAATRLALARRRAFDAGV